jgi:hypothetical protein
MLPTHPVLWIEKGFSVLWEDSLAAVAQSCHWAETPWIARLAMLNTIFSAEAAANCCIASLANQAPAWKKWKKDKRSETIKKFDHYLRETKNRPLEMTSLKVKALVEAFVLRNSIVHRKQVAVEMSKAGEFKRANQFFPVLHIPTNPELWCSHTAKKILVTISEFFEHFFIGCCGQNKEQTNALLQDSIDQPIINRSKPVDEDGWYPTQLPVLLKHNAICSKWIAHLHQEPDH